MTTISVVIPTCDRPDSLVEAVNCALAQSFPAHEIIVVNNGGRPLGHQAWPGQVRTSELPPYAGVSRARNEGAALATGDYIAFLDDDDLWELDYLRKAAALLDEQRADCLVTRKDALSDGRIGPYKNADGQLDLEHLLVKNPGVGGQNTIVRRQAFLAIGGYDANLISGSDKALIIDLLIKGYVVAAAPKIQAILRQHGGSRLTDAEPMHRGITSFVSKYGGLMSPGQRNFNWLKIYHYRYLARGHKSDYWNFCLRYLLNKLYRARDHRIPPGPRFALRHLLESPKLATRPKMIGDDER